MEPLRSVLRPAARLRVARWMEARSARFWALLLGVVALLVRLPLIFADHAITPGGDSAGYVEIARSLADGDGFGEAYRTPGYPVILAALDQLPGRLEDAVVVFQLLCGVALVASVVLIAWRYLGRPTALVAGGMLALTPAGPYLEYAILSDFIFSVVLFAVAVVLGRVLLDTPPRLRGLIAVGALCAVAAYMRPSGQFLVLAPLLATPLVTKSRRETVRATLVIGATFAVLVAPWIVRNAIEFDTPSMSAVSGDTLFVRAFEVDKLPIPTDTPVGQVANEAAARRGDTRLVTAVTAALQDRGIGRFDTLKAQQTLAETAIARHPWEYTVGTVREVGDLRLDIREVDIGSDVGPHLPNPPEYTKSIWDFAGTLGGVWWILSLHMFAGLLVLLAPERRARVIGTAMVAVWLAVALGTALGRGALTRYALELAPLSLVLGSYGAVLVTATLVRALQGARPSNVNGSPP